MACVGMEMVAGLGAYAGDIARGLTKQLADKPGIEILPDALRHLIFRASDLPIPCLRTCPIVWQWQMSTSRCGSAASGSAPHIYNDDSDVDRCSEVLRGALYR